MKPTVVTLTAIALILSICMACNQSAVEVKQATISQDSMVIRGRYLVEGMGCGDCHSPKKFGPMGPQEDSALRLSGHPAAMPLAPIDTSAAKNWVLFNGMQTVAVGPWGISFAANITSDSTGIGNWTEQQFINALRKGKSKGLDNNRMLLPPMPWPNYARLHDDDLKAMFAYLKSTKPVKNVVPQPVAPQRRG